MNPESNPTRTLTLVLPEADWKALREAEPDAIGWLRAQIQNRLATPGTAWSSPAPATTAESWWGTRTKLLDFAVRSSLGPLFAASQGSSSFDTAASRQVRLA